MITKMVKFNIEVSMPEQWAVKFIQMLDCMRWCANVGASRTVAFRADGDGDFRPFNFKVNGNEVKKMVDWEKNDQEWPPRTNYAPQEPPPPFKTWRGVDFFFDAG